MGSTARRSTASRTRRSTGCHSPSPGTHAWCPAPRAPKQLDIKTGHGNCAASARSWRAGGRAGAHAGRGACPQVIACEEGRLLSNLRRARTHFGGHVEMYEAALPPVEMEGLDPGEDDEASGSSRSSGSSSSSGSGSGSGSSSGSASSASSVSSDGPDDEVGAIKALAASHLFARSGLALTAKVSPPPLVLSGHAASLTPY